LKLCFQCSFPEYQVHYQSVTFSKEEFCMTFTVTVQRLWPTAFVVMLSSAPTVVYAQGGDANLIHACVSNANGAVRIIPPTSTCKNNESPLAWNIQGPAGPAFPITCPADSAPVGTTCVDKYEASVWQIPSGNAALIEKVKQGTATVADLRAGGVQKGVPPGGDDYSCNDSGNDCTDLYAVSVRDVMPSAFVTWFQAQQFCRAAGKRLLTNAEWQSAAAGTSDSLACSIDENGVNPTGRCVSNAGVFDMVGNVDEWVADWVSPGEGCARSLFETEDLNCMTEALGEGTPPAALVRGGGFTDNVAAGVFSVHSAWVAQPYHDNVDNGFRCAR
jgi:hypothetical protein